jgi:TP901 family phage tail tape measure protein
LGVSQEELFAVFGAMTGVTGDAEQVATQLRSALSSLRNPTQELTEVFKLLGVESGRALIDQKGLIGAFKAIKKAEEDLDLPAQKLIRRIEGVTAVTQLSTTLFDKYNDVLEANYNATGTQAEAYEQITSGINEAGFTIQQSIQRMQVALSTLGDSLAPEFAEMADSISEFIFKFR